MLLQDTPTISAMDLRKEPGRYLDRVNLRSESFIVARAGKPKAVLVPVTTYKLIEQARQRLFTLNEELRQAFADLSSQEVDALVDEAIAATRNETTTT